jgi:5-methylcytosine-specific restriction endonuclease McrA
MITILYPAQDGLDSYFTDIKDELLKRIKAIKSQNRISINSVNFRITNQIKKILDYLEDERNLKKLIQSSPNDLTFLIKTVYKKFPKSHYKKEGLNRILYRIFVDYGYDKIDKLKFIQNINLGSCPYCNRNYIFSVNKSGSVKPEIDHFYPKSKYPYLAVSYFNLIPSCPTCNGFGAKEDKDTFYAYPISNPYKLKENDFKFSISPENIDFFNVENKKYDFDSFEIELYGNKANLEVFKLEELYKQHKNIVLELLIKKVYYPKSYIDELKKFGFNDDEIYRYLVCNYKNKEDLHKRPLSKLIKDISEELQLL